MRSEQARVGKKVRVRSDQYEPELRGVVGSVLRCYGEPEYSALEVIPKDGRSRLFLAPRGGGGREPREERLPLCANFGETLHARFVG